jgi:CRP-like cAMP-binding protein
MVSTSRKVSAKPQLVSLSPDKKSPRAVDIVRPVLTHLAPIPNGEWRFLESQLQLRTLQRGEALTQAGEVATCFGFVSSGLIRKLHVTERGRRMVRGFGQPGDIVGAYASVLSGEPSTLRVEALLETQLFVVEVTTLNQLYTRHSYWDRLGRRLAEHFLLERETRAHELLTLSATERYARFCATHRAILPLLKSYDIASYLGVTPVSLSRLRARQRRAPSR